MENSIEKRQNEKIKYFPVFIKSRYNKKWMYIIWNDIFI
jgi:hypothetical protein